MAIRTKLCRTAFTLRRWMLFDHGFALIWTGFIDGLRGWDRDLMEKNWREDPIIAEGNWSYDDMKDQRTHGTVAENLDVALEWHSNFEHFYIGSDAYPRAMREDRASWERGLKSGGLGYRLVPTSLSWPSRPQRAISSFSDKRG